MSDATRPELTVYVRSLVPKGSLSQQERVFARLETLTDSNAIARFEVRVVGDGLPTDSACSRTAAARFLGSLLSTCVRWADENDYSFESVFRRHEICSEFLDYECRVTTFPQVLLVERQDEEIRFITPVSNGEHTYSVSDHLDSIDPAETETIPGRSGATTVSFEPEFGRSVSSRAKQ